MKLHHICFGAVVTLAPAAMADELHVPSQYPTIEAAIAASRAGDEIVLADGVFTGAGNDDIQMPAHAITLHSASGDPALCVMDPRYDHRAMLFYPGASSDIVIRGIGVHNAGGYVGYGGAAMIIGASPTFQQCVFDHNEALDLVCQGGEGWGGAIYMADSSARFEECVFSNNTAAAYECDPGEGRSAWGGAVSIDDGEAVFVGCDFTNNLASARSGYGFGGAVAGRAVFVDCTFTGNSVRADGGFAAGGAVATDGLLEGCTLTDNSAAGFDAEGGAISGQFRAVNTLFRDNSSSTSGGAVAAGGYPGGAVTELVNCRLIGNYAVGRGSAIWMRYGAGSLVNLVIADNEGPSWCVGAVRLAPGTSLSVTSSTIWNNGPVCDGSAFVLDTEAGKVTELDIANSIVFAGGARPITMGGPEAIVSITYSDIERGWTGEGNISADPLLVDPGAGDWRPGPGSPVIDAGANDLVPPDTFDLDGDGDTTEPLPLDLDGAVRFVDDPAAPDTGRGTAPLVDMGGFERQVVCYPDCDGSGELDLFDFLCFQNAFAAGDPYADCDGSGALDLFDFLCFQNEFATGCPR
ncbi:MAG: right-handed parallel beta-helix repeat-containing protein [Phycisphaerales bacterium JB039]